LRSLGRHDGERARQAGYRPPRRCRGSAWTDPRPEAARPRGPTASTARAPRSASGRRYRAPRRALAHREGARDGLATARPAKLGASSRIRHRARARLARADDDRTAARSPELDHVRLRVGLPATPARVPRGAKVVVPDAIRPNASRATARHRRSSCSTRG
jgi:hypothetical protein